MSRSGIGTAGSLSLLHEIEEANRAKAREIALAKAFRPGPDHFELVDGKLCAATEQGEQTNKESGDQS